MNKYLFGIYRVVVPKPLRTKILKRNLRIKIIEQFDKMPPGEVTEEQKEVVRYLAENPVSIFPYPFGDLYKPADIDVKYDREKRMNWVNHEGRKLYFKRGWNANRIKRGYSDLQREQDPASPHRYLTDKFFVSEDDVIADIGAAEGNFSLSVAEKARKIFIFEYNNDWARALKTTFEPFGSKVEIINKMVSSVNDASHIRLDTFLSENKEVNFLKIDVDGAEEEVMGSGMEILRSKRPLKIALCTYHKAEDESKFTKLLSECGFRVEPSHGYMVPFYDKKLQSPWLRRGLIRAIRE